MNLIDTHCHLHFSDYDEDRDEVIRRSIEKGVVGFVEIGTTLDDSKCALDLARKHPEIFAAIGVHPTESHRIQPDDFAQFENLLKSPKVVGLGEIGLDYYHKDSPKETQQEVLTKFLDIYKRGGKPLVVHCREAYDDLFEILKSNGQAYRGTIHCYSSDAKNMRKFLDLGFHISFGGAITYKKSDVLREACAECPMDRILLETDAPYLAPQSVRGKRNESFYVAEAAALIAKLHSTTIEEVARMTTQNAKTLFGI